jgi:hypothetical protein
MAKLSTSSLQFEIGTPLYIERHMFAQNIKGTAKLIGAHEPGHLLIEMPMIKNAPMLATVEENVIVRFIQTGKMFGFKAEVLKIILTPFPVVILQCPKEVEEMTLRKHERLNCHFPSTLKLHPVQTDPNDNKGQGKPRTPPPPPLIYHIIDLAEGGCQALTLIHRERDFSPAATEFQAQVPPDKRPYYAANALKEHYSADRTAALSFELPKPMNFSFPNLACKIRWCKTINMHYLLGLSFTDLSTEISQNIESVIDYQKKFFTTPDHLL